MRNEAATRVPEGKFQSLPTEPLMNDMDERYFGGGVAGCGGLYNEWIDTRALEHWRVLQASWPHTYYGIASIFHWETIKQIVCCFLCICSFVFKSVLNAWNSFLFKFIA